MNSQHFNTHRAKLEQLVYTHAPSDHVASAMLQHIKHMAAAMQAEEAEATTRLHQSHALHRAPVARIRQFILGEVRAA
ncbi:hypothetical protein [Acetobacter sp. LMG 32666]|uniref:hypothetical protein n=1 Tax=Acetobacter sp. LMG 32666 TaxID=2959295 RepID=UPI0030C7A649